MAFDPPTLDRPRQAPCRCLPGPAVATRYRILSRLTLALTLACTLAVPVEAALYRWVDEQGNVHYSDIIPPASVRQGHTELRKDGIPIQTVPPARSPEQIKADELLTRLRAGQERLLKQQATADRGLLHTFPSEAELMASNQNQLGALETMIQVTRNNILRQEAWLASLRTYAGNLERAGKPVPEEFTISARKTERSIRLAQSSIATREAQQAALKSRLDRDLNRYRQLQASGRLAALSANKRHTDLHRVIPCASDAACDRLWDQARDYLLGQPGLAIQLDDSEDLFVAAPRSGGRAAGTIAIGGDLDLDLDADLVLARIPDEQGPGATLFLELRCQAAAMGHEGCWRPELVRTIQGLDAALR